MSVQNISVKIDFPSFRKTIQINMNPRTSIKQHLPLFGAKFDSDFSSFQVSAYLRTGNKERIKIPIDVPLVHAIGGVPTQQIVIDMMLSYDGG